MIKTLALKKLVRYLESAKISEVEFELKDSRGFFTIYHKGVAREIRICHDDTQVRITETKVKYK